MSFSLFRKTCRSFGPLSVLGLSLGLTTLAACGSPATDHGRGGEFRRFGFDEATLAHDGTPSFLSGRMTTGSTLPAGMDAGSAAAHLAQKVLLSDLRSSYRLAPRTTLSVRTNQLDEAGNRLVRLQQRHGDLRVLGSEVIVQLGRDGVIEAIHGRLTPDLVIDARPTLSANEAVQVALSTLSRPGLPTQTHGTPELAIFMEGTTPRLVYAAVVEYVGTKGRALEEIYVSAQDGSVQERLSRVYEALNRDVYSLDKVCVKDGSELPGKPVISEGGMTMDMPGLRAYNNSGAVYWFYKHSFGRDSYDDMGAKLTSSVMATFDTGMGGCDGGNAAWVGAPYSIMLYGNGSLFGFLLKEMTLGFDVAAHELTHAVTNLTSDLVYKNESGALNEAMSDILGATAEAWVAAGGSAAGPPTTYSATDKTWKIGEDVVGPIFPIPGGALRSMSNPTIDMMSKDFYAERYIGMDDNGGVHINSGIANLAFYLMVQGGSHPRMKSPTVVDGIGLDKAMRIFYYANARLLTSTSDFQAARYATARAAEILYGRCGREWQAVHAAWDAVGVAGAWALCVSPPSGF
ncbi:MAG: M4 family metallopeptidase [Myxococcales bacterium]|nr:M4 family metallopeptidase [Myxococcales bacterium]